MPSVAHQLVTPRISVAGSPARSFAIAALMGATMLASPLSAARADTVHNAATQLAQAAAPQASAPQAAAPKTEAGAGATVSKGETVEQRITSLHAALKITSAEDAKWNDVAQAMRENAAGMDKLVAESRTTAPQNMSAVDDLKLYQKFAQAHVDGLKNLISSFSTLYEAMPDAQKKIADQVFESSRQAASTHGQTG
jgi:periplasmic protein CpxP/Spy